MRLTNKLKTIAAQCYTEGVRVELVQGTFYVRARDARNAPATAATVRAVSRKLRDLCLHMGRGCVLKQPSAYGFWNMGHFCREGVVQVVNVNMTQEEKFTVLCGGQP